MSGVPYPEEKLNWGAALACASLTKIEFLELCSETWDMLEDARKALLKPPVFYDMEKQRSPLKWFGGKRQLAAKIISLMPGHRTYCEVFSGAAHVLFRKPRSATEVLNDINGELVNFWRCVREGVSFFDMMYNTALYSREEFMAWRDAQPMGLDPEHRAWRFWLLNQMGWGGRAGSGRKGSFGTSRVRNTQVRSFFTGKFAIHAAHKRLEAVIIENLPWEQCVDQYDSPETLFYLDPPYYGCEDDYGPDIFSRGDFATMASRLYSLEGKFILSINDCPETREIFRDFPILAEETLLYNVDANHPKEAKELIIGNFSPPHVDKQLPLM